MNVPEMNKTKLFHAVYYQLRPFIPRRLQIWMRGIVVRRKRKRFADRWPILRSAARRPANWPGWPGRQPFALVLTHDVESAKGVANCKRLAQMELDLGFRSSFNFVSRRYPIPEELPRELTDMGCEVGVHGVYHDGKLFQSRSIFQTRARIINDQLERWQAVGFRAPAMHHNLDWLHELNIAYDLSTFDTDPFEPQADGVGTIFPFWVGPNGRPSRYLEMPYTLGQDFTLFILMQETSINLWTTKLDWVVDQGGMALLNTHPDYMAFGGGDTTIETYPVDYYLDFLRYVKHTYSDGYWNALPREVEQFYSSWAPFVTGEIGDVAPTVQTRNRHHSETLKTTDTEAT